MSRVTAGEPLLHLKYFRALQKVPAWSQESTLNAVFLSCRALGSGQGAALLQWTWTYWVSSRTRTGWGRLWRPPRRRVAGVTGSGRSVRKTGRRAPSARSGCHLSDCFLETHTYIYRHRRGKKGGKWAGWRLLRHPPQKGDPREQSQKDHLLWRKKSELADRLEFQLYKYLLEAEVLWNNLQINLVSIK